MTAETLMAGIDAACETLRELVKTKGLQELHFKVDVTPWLNVPSITYEIKKASIVGDESNAT